MERHKKWAIFIGILLLSFQLAFSLYNSYEANEEIQFEERISKIRVQMWKERAEKLRAKRMALMNK